jgi:hypothetical protein
MMALIRDFEIAGTGLVIPGAYHVITQLDVEKRMADRTLPQPNGRVYQGDLVDADMEWTAGYYGRMVICVWKDAASRAANKNMLGVINAEYKVPAIFRLDTDSSDSYLTQAYAFLKTVEYYAGATEA